MLNASSSVIFELKSPLFPWSNVALGIYYISIGIRSYKSTMMVILNSYLRSTVLYGPFMELLYGTANIRSCNGSTHRCSLKVGVVVSNNCESFSFNIWKFINALFCECLGRGFCLRCNFCKRKFRFCLLGILGKQMIFNKSCLWVQSHSRDHG